MSISQTRPQIPTRYLLRGPAGAAGVGAEERRFLDGGGSYGYPKTEANLLKMQRYMQILAALFCPQKHASKAWNCEYLVMVYS